MSFEVSPEATTEMDAQETAGPQVVDDVAQTDTQSPVAEVEAPATETVAEIATPAYQPNFKVSVRGEEKEIDEMFKSLVKDADSEKKVKELFEKAYGIDHVKMDRKAIKEEYEGFKGQVVPYLQEYHKFTTLRDKGNIGAAMQVAGISDDQLFQYCLQKLNMEQDPNQASLYKSHTEASLREIEMEAQLNRYRQMEEQTRVQSFQSELESSVASMKDIADQVDQRMGRQGAFMDEVIAYGVFEHNRGNVLSVADATQAVAQKYKPFITPVAAPSPAAPVVQHQRPATMPNVGSSTASPVRTLPRTVDDIRRAAREAV